MVPRRPTRGAGGNGSAFLDIEEFDGPGSADKAEPMDCLDLVARVGWGSTTPSHACSPDVESYGRGSLGASPRPPDINIYGVQTVLGTRRLAPLALAFPLPLGR